jgi:adenylate cyclase
MADIFVSYSRVDRDRVEHIVAQFESAHFSVWWDKDLQGGAVFSKKIEAEIQISKIVVVLWTRASITSQWVADEAALGQRHAKLLPVLLDNIEPPIGFRQIHTIAASDFGGEISKEFLAHLTETVALRMGPENDDGSPDARPPAASIAVLPFVNMSSDPEQEYFSDGISEELLNLLAKTSRMHVTARTSAFQFKGRNLDISKIGKILGVVYVLEGSVRKSGNRVRIAAQLIEVATGFHKWSESYDRTMHDIFAIQDEISAAIVDALKEHILGDVKAPVATRSVSTAAYDEYLIGHQSIRKRTQESIERAKHHFEKSLSLDPDFLPALIGLADAILLLSDDNICYGKVPLQNALEMALPLMDRALLQNPNSEDVHASRSFYFHLSGDSERAQFHAEKAIAINPNCSRAYRLLGFILKKSGNPHALVIKAREKVLHLDPASPTDLTNLLGELPVRSRFGEARALLDRIDALEPGSVLSDWGRFVIAWNRGNIKESLAIYLTSKTLLQDRQWANGIQWVLTLFGYGPLVEDLNLPSALMTYCQYGIPDEANRLGALLSDQAITSGSRYSQMAMSLWHVLEGRYQDADSILRSFDEIDPENWGVHFDIDEFCLGARLSWFVRKRLGDFEGCAYFNRKLNELYSVCLLTHEGVHKATSYIGACIANMEGDKQTALEEMKTHVDRFPGSSITIFYDPLLQNIADEPEFQKLKKQASDYIAAEKEKAIVSGLLPPPRDLFKRS